MDVTREATGRERAGRDEVELYASALEKLLRKTQNRELEWSRAREHHGKWERGVFNAEIDGDQLKLREPNARVSHCDLLLKARGSDSWEPFPPKKFRSELRSALDDLMEAVRYQSLHAPRFAERLLGVKANSLTE